MPGKFDQFRVVDSDEDSSAPPPQQEREEEEEVPAPPPQQEATPPKEEVAAPPAAAAAPAPAEEAAAPPAAKAAPVEPPHEEAPPAAVEAAEVTETPVADTPSQKKKKVTAAKKSGSPQKEEKKTAKKATTTTASPPKKAEAAPAAAAAPAHAPAAEKKTTSPKKKKKKSPSPKKEASPERTAAGKTKVQTTKKTAEAPSSPTTVKKRNASSPFGKTKPKSPEKVQTVKQGAAAAEPRSPPKPAPTSHTPKGRSPQRPTTAPAVDKKSTGPVYSRALRKSTTPLSAQSTTPTRRSVRPGPARTLPEEEYEHDPGRALRADDPVFLQIRRQRRASSTGSMALANERHPFVLVAAGQPIPHLPPALESALEAHYVDGLLRLPLPEIERVVAALCTTQEQKPVMTHFKLLLQQQQSSHRLSGANSPRHRRLSSPERLSEQGWCRSTKMEEPATSIARAARPTSASASQRRRIDTSRSDENAVRNFKHVFGNEVRAVFLEECAAVCLSRRARFYREQPRMVIERGIVVPDQIIDPFYEQAVSKLLYRLFGWTEEEAIQYAGNVVAIVKEELPPLSHAQETTEAPFTDPEA